MMESRKIEFPGHTGDNLAARLDLPAKPHAFALFAHCFTCGKDIFAASRIAKALTGRGIAVLRFDFTGIGASEGEFANTNFSSNVEDLVAAADYLRKNHAAPSLLIGHSLGGAAVLAAAPHVPEATASSRLVHRPRQSTSRIISPPMWRRSSGERNGDSYAGGPLFHHHQAVPRRRRGSKHPRRSGEAEEGASGLPRAARRIRRHRQCKSDFCGGATSQELSFARYGGSSAPKAAGCDLHRRCDCRLGIALFGERRRVGGIAARYGPGA